MGLFLVKSTHKRQEQYDRLYEIKVKISAKLIDF